jgi:class 3 adenylate cyclase/Tfp pilus assembly protein PilF
MRWFVSLLLLFTMQQTFAQKPHQSKLSGKLLLDSLIKALPVLKEDTNKALLLGSISLEYSRIDPDEGLRYGRQDSVLAEQIGWKKGIAVADNSLGINYHSKGDYDLALEYFYKTLKIDDEIGNRQGVGSANCNIGMVYQWRSDYPKALEYYFKALKIDEEIGNKRNAAAVSSNIGLAYQYENDNAQALEYYFKALKSAEEAGEKLLTGNITGNIGMVYEAELDHSKALEYYFKALKIDEEVGSQLSIAVVSGDIGKAYRDERDYRPAIAWHFKALQMHKEMGAKNYEAATLVALANDYLRIVADPQPTSKIAKDSGLLTAPYLPDSLIPRGRSQLLYEAAEYYNRGIALAKQIGELKTLVNGYEGLSVTDSLLGDYKGAYLAHLQYTIFKDSVFNKDNSIKIAKLEMHKKISEDSLEAEHEKSVTELKYRQQRSYTWIGGGCILALLAFSFFIIREREKAERARNRAEKEREKSDELLLNILPAEVAEELKTSGSSAARQFDNVTVLFTDFVNFTKTAERMSPQALIDELHTCFKAFDEITSRYNIEKIKTIGDAYLAVAGLPVADVAHAEHVVKAAIEINSFMTNRYKEVGDRTFRIHMGIHSGNVVAGIVGVKKFAYDIWGDTVNIAARMEENCEAGKINLSETTYEMVKDKFTCHYRGEIEAKNKGVMKMYYIV